ncbi:MAG: glycosyltransferase family 39 protein [Candidatus Promineifilaceae bacterium]
MKRRHLVPLAFWTLLCGLYFLPIVLAVEHFPTSDFSEQFHAFAMFQARELSQGRLPLWSPHSYGGVPFVADPQAAVFYVPRLLTVAFSLPWGLSYYALELEAILHVWLAGVFTYAFVYTVLRRSLPGVLAAVVFALGGYLLSYPLLQLAVLETIIWLPLILYLLRRGIMGAPDSPRASPLPWLVAAGLATAVSATAGHPQTFLHVVYLVVAYFVFLTIRARWRWRWIGLFGGLMLLLALALSAAYWLPVLRYQSYTVRSHVDYDFVAGGQPMLNYVQMLAPGTLSLWSPEYWSIGALCLALLAWLGRKVQAAQMAEILFWSVTLVLSLWLALGDAGVLFQLVYRIAPGFSLFRQQERVLALASFSGAMLAAQGLNLWLTLDQDRCRLYVRRALTIVGVALLVAALVLFMARPIRQADWLPTLGLQLLKVLVVGGLLLIRRWPRHQALLLIALMALDLYTATFAQYGRQPGSPSVYWPRPAWVETLIDDYQHSQPSRLDSRGLFSANVGEIYGWEDIRGISPLKPQVLATLETLPLERRWQLLNVSHTISQDVPEGAELTMIGQFEDGLVPDRPLTAMTYRYEDALPRAWLVHQATTVSDAEAALEFLRDPNYDLTERVILQAPVAEADNLAPDDGAAPETVSVQEQRPGELSLQVETAAPAFLVISEWDYPGWKAHLDGQAVDLHRADFALQGIFVAPGAHLVELSFQPGIVTAGLLVSFLALLSALVLAWRWRPLPSIAEPGDGLRIPWPRLPDIDLGSTVHWLSRTRAFWLVALLTLSSFALRIYRLGYQELRGDEAFSYLFARQPAGEIIPSLLAEGDPHSPLHYLLLHGWMGLAGDSEFAMRFLSALAGTLSVPLAYWLGRQVSGRWLGLFVASLMAMSQSLVWVSQDVRNQYVFAVFFSLLATFLLVRALGRRHWWLWALYAFACALTVYSHYYGLFVLASHALYLLAGRFSGKQRLAWVAAITGALVLFAPWLGASLPGLTEAGQLSAPATPELARHLTDTGIELVAGSAFTLGIGRWLFVLLLVVALAGGRDLWRRQRPFAILLLTWLFATFLGIYLVRFSRATFNAFYIVVAGPAWWALVGAGIVSLWRRRSGWSRYVALATLALLVATSFFSLANQYFNPSTSRSLGYREMAAQLAEQAQPGDVFVAHYPDPSFDYYLRDVPLPRTMQPASYHDADGRAEADLAALAGRYNRLWFVPAHRSNWDPEDVAFRWLDYHLLLEQETVHDRLTLAAYRPLAAAESILAPVDVSLDDQLLLEDAYLTVDGLPQPLLGPSPVPLAPGSVVELTLVWRSLSEIADNYTVFSHMLSQDGRLITQHDGVPAQGTRPTSSWQPDERIVDKHNLLVPEDVASGTGTLVVGLYRPENVERQIFSNGLDYIWLADLIFQQTTPGGSAKDG